jgi:hypothetical protein
MAGHGRCASCKLMLVMCDPHMHMRVGAIDASWRGQQRSGTVHSCEYNTCYACCQHNAAACCCDLALLADKPLCSASCIRGLLSHVQWCLKRTTKWLQCKLPAAAM